jgi:hypothetical protein
MRACLAAVALRDPNNGPAAGTLEEPQVRRGPEKRQLAQKPQRSAALLAEAGRFRVLFWAVLSCIIQDGDTPLGTGGNTPRLAALVKSYQANGGRAVLFCSQASREIASPGGRFGDKIIALQAALLCREEAPRVERGVS